MQVILSLRAGVASDGVLAPHRIASALVARRGGLDKVLALPGRYAHGAGMGATDAATEVGPGVYRICVAHTNCYLVVTSDGMTLVDAGLPASRRPLVRLLDSMGATLGDIDVVLLTHGHFDHVGMAAALRTAHGVPVRVHPRDQWLARHPYRYRHQAARLPYLGRYPQAIPVLLGMAFKGALTVRGVDASPDVVHGQALAVPGNPIPLWTPGHTDGHCGYYFAEAGVLLAGDAIVTLDPYTHKEGPRIVAGAATADSGAALASVDAFLETEARTVLPGHGEPWTDGIVSAVRAARRVGAS